MTGKLKILFVEDVKSDAELIWREIEKNNIYFSKVLVDTRAGYLEKMKDFAPDLIISDYKLPQFNGMEALLIRNELAPLIPFILVTGSINEEVAVDCIKAGADDYILKENLSRLVPAITTSINKIKLAKEKKTAEDELQKSELRLQKAQFIAHVGNWELDLSNKLVWSSDEAMRIYGFENDSHEIPLERIRESPLPEYRATLDESMYRLLKYNEPYDVEFNIKRKGDGAIRSIHSKAELVIAPDGEQVTVIGVIQDITDRKKAEEVLNLERKLLRAIVDLIPDAIYVKDAECRKIMSNIADVNYIGSAKEDEVLGKTDIELFPDENGLRGYADDKEVINSGEAFFEREEDFVDKNGGMIRLLTSKIPLYDKDGNITGLVGVGRDVTHRKRAEEALKQSLDFSESLLKTIPFGMDIVDESGNVVFQSDNFVRRFGEKAIGQKCWDLYREDKKQCTECPLLRGINIGKTEVYESHGVLGNRIFEINHTGMIYQGKKAMLEIFQDITERKENEEELIRSKEKAEESDKLKTAFLHNISHEIRTPMNAIVGFSALLGEPEVDEQSRKSYIEVIMQSSNHLLSIITDIVDISNIEANLIKTVKNEINVNKTLKYLYNQFITKANEKQIELVCEAGLSDPEAMILTDRTKLTQILSNLISNALKFTDNGIIKIEYSLKKNFLEFCIKDTGIGISPLHHERIFDRFYQVQNNVARLYEGTGLGLAISKAYVELLGGKIWLSSEPGNGTTFFFTIPYEKRDSVSIPGYERKATASFVFPVKKVILVAEDIESNFKLISYFLEGSNAEVLHANNGKEAVEKCLSMGHIDLILMDIKMPVMDGYTAVKLIREKNTEIPIIAQTAYADDRERAIECGCSGFLSKPFNKKALFEILCEFI